MSGEKSSPKQPATFSHADFLNAAGSELGVDVANLSQRTDAPHASGVDLLNMAKVSHGESLDKQEELKPDLAVSLLEHAIEIQSTLDDSQKADLDNDLYAVYAALGQTDKAEAYIEEIEDIDQRTIAHSELAAIEAMFGRVDQGLQRAWPLGSDYFAEVSTIGIKTYARKGDLASARRVMDAIVGQDIWDMVEPAAAMALAGDSDYLADMRQDLNPGATTDRQRAAIISAYAIAGDVETAKSLNDDWQWTDSSWMHKAGFEIIKSLSNQALLDEAQIRISRIVQQSDRVQCINALVSGYLKQGNIRKAEILLDQVTNQAYHDAALRNIAAAYAVAGDRNKFQELVAQDSAPDQAYKRAAAECVKQGLIERAISYADSIRDDSTHAYAYTEMAFIVLAKIEGIDER